MTAQPSWLLVDLQYDLASKSARTSPGHSAQRSHEYLCWFNVGMDITPWLNFDEESLSVSFNLDRLRAFE